MDRRFFVFALAAVTLPVTGCEKKTALPAREIESSAYLASVQGRLVDGMSALAASPQRFVAERHKVDVVTRESELQSSWESAVSFCATIRCEVVSSSITLRTAESVPSGSISLRVAPEDLQKLITHVEGLGKIARHTTDREDETTQVIDTEAKIKNLIAFRDTLRAMLAKPSATVSNLIQIDQQLTDTQAELDSETAQRKVLANETETITVDISFGVEESAAGTGGFSEVWSALHDAGSVLGDSIANVITTIVFLIPWLILILPVAWFLAKAWRRFRKRRATSPPPS